MSPAWIKILEAPRIEHQAKTKLEKLLAQMQKAIEDENIAEVPALISAEIDRCMAAINTALREANRIISGAAPVDLAFFTSAPLDAMRAALRRLLASLAQIRAAKAASKRNGLN